MKTSLFLFAILCLNLPIHAQDLPEILKTKQFNRGIYKDFGEFLKNEPSIHSSDTVIKAKSFFGGKMDSCYQLIKQDTAWSRKDRKKIWGLSDGKEIYINESNYSSGDCFRRIVVGRYCYFLGTVVYTTGPIGTTGTKTWSEDGYFIMNINNGNSFLLTKDVLRTILKKDKDLSDLYESGNKKGNQKIMVKYIEEYNKKHFDEIMLQRNDSVLVVLYRLDDKGSDDAIIRLSDSAEVNLKVNNMYQFKSNERFSNICINKKCKEYALPNHKVIYFKCTWNKKLNLFELKVMDPEIATFYVKKIQTANKENN
jgi:hypothetical protein